MCQRLPRQLVGLLLLLSRRPPVPRQQEGLLLLLSRRPPLPQQPRRRPPQRLQHLL